METPAEEAEDAPEYDPRKPQDVSYDAIADQVREATYLVRDVAEMVRESLSRSGNTQTVIHKTEGMGAIGIVCASICVACVLFLILGAILIVPELHDLKAWQDINRKDIARLQALHEQQK